MLCLIHVLTEVPGLTDLNVLLLQLEEEEQEDKFELSVEVSDPEKIGESL